MRIKNVSATEIKLPDFELTLAPGELGDLSKFDFKTIHSNKRLNILFDKGLLVNLGSSTPAGSVNALKSAKERIAKMGLTDYVIKQAKKSPAADPRKKISQILADSPKPESFSNEKFNDEYFQNMNPGKQREDFSTPIPRPKIQEKFNSIQIDPRGYLSEFGSKGFIEANRLTGDMTVLNEQLPTPVKEFSNNILEVIGEGGEVIKVNIDEVRERMMKKCLGYSKSGKPCKKWAVSPFQSCLTHLSKEEQKEYDKTKKRVKK
jgi:hypothetical protein